MPEQHLNPDALKAAVAALHGDNCPDDPEPGEFCDCDAKSLERMCEVAVSAYLSALPAQPEHQANSKPNQNLEFDTVNNVMEDFINDRPGYITALKNTTGNDSMGDYWRWSGHAEARRQLATKLGWTVPHNPGETTRPVEG